MEEIGREERKHDEHINTSLGDLPPMHGASFVEHGEGLNHTQPLSARFLPCHYFDFIVGTSTGG